MKFKKYDTGDGVYYFSGIYKITKYEFNVDEASNKPHYKAYYLSEGNKCWGDYVGGKSAQLHKTLNLQQCKALCEEHAKTYTPTKPQLAQAIRARKAWVQP